MERTFRIDLLEDQRDKKLFYCVLNGVNGKIATFYAKKEEMYKNVLKSAKNDKNGKLEILFDLIIDSPKPEGYSLILKVIPTANDFVRTLILESRFGEIKCLLSKPDLNKMLENQMLVERGKGKYISYLRTLPSMFKPRLWK